MVLLAFGLERSAVWEYIQVITFSSLPDCDSNHAVGHEDPGIGDAARLTEMDVTWMLLLRAVVRGLLFVARKN